MQPLIAHREHPPLAVTAVHAELLELSDGRTMVRFRIEGISELVLPAFAGRGRQDELWKSTCFELFLRDEGGTYREFNFSPSGMWAAYRFERYRDGMTPVDPTMTPEITIRVGESMLTAHVTLAATDLAKAKAAALTAVIEESDGRKSYWSLAHPEGQPDFHDPACFAIPLGAAESS